VKWGPGDLAQAFGPLLSAGLAHEVFARGVGARAYRAAIGLALAGGLLLVWMNLALGIIRAEDHPANMIYWGVLAVGITGALAARMQAKGMAYSLAATAGAQALAAAIALAAGLGSTARDLAQILLLNGFFVLLFLGSALLFRKAGGATAGRA
jgi:hypothetical protein